MLLFMTFGEGFLLGVPRQCHPCFSATSWGFHGQTDRCGICCNGTGKMVKVAQLPSFPGSYAWKDDAVLLLDQLSANARPNSGGAFPVLKEFDDKCRR